VLSTVEGYHLDIGGLVDHMGVRERDAGRIDDDARPEAALRDPLGDLAEEAPEELLAEELFERRSALRPSAPARERVDVDHGRLDGIRDRREGAALGRHLNGEHRDGADGRLRYLRGTTKLRSGRRKRAQGDTGRQGEHQRPEEVPPFEPHHRVASIVLSPARARRSRSPSRVSVRFSS
jgi:hypothetical protein